jgi:hypothetical protein
MMKFQVNFTRVVLVPSMFAVTAGTNHETRERQIASESEQVKVGMVPCC